MPPAAPKQTDVRRVLVVVKTSDYERYLDEGALAGPEDGTSDRGRVLEQLHAAHDAHAGAQAHLERALEASGLDVTWSARPTRRATQAADLVVTLGGDGTFLRTAQHVTTTPMLGVNSAPAFSVGHYCATDVHGFADALDAIRRGQSTLAALTRIAVTIEGRRMHHLALNDVLFAHHAPAASTRYLLRIGDDYELHISSGVWVSTASGATGAIHSAGGEPMAPGDPRLQYVVREPYGRAGMHSELVRGFVHDEIGLVSKSPRLVVCLDGHHRVYRVELGARVTLTPAAGSLHVFGYPSPD